MGEPEKAKGDCKGAGKCPKKSTGIEQPLATKRKGSSLTPLAKHQASDLGLRTSALSQSACVNASAPETISSNSFVIAACRALLYCSCSDWISSLAFSVAFSMAAIRAPVSAA